MSASLFLQSFESIQTIEDATMLRVSSRQVLLTSRASALHRRSLLISLDDNLPQPLIMEVLDDWVDGVYSYVCPRDSAAYLCLSQWLPTAQQPAASRDIMVLVSNSRGSVSLYSRSGSSRFKKEKILYDLNRTVEYMSVWSTEEPSQRLYILLASACGSIAVGKMNQYISDIQTISWTTTKISQNLNVTSFCSHMLEQQCWLVTAAQNRLNWFKLDSMSTEPYTSQTTSGAVLSVCGNGCVTDDPLIFLTSRGLVYQIEADPTRRTHRQHHMGTDMYGSIRGSIRGSLEGLYKLQQEEIHIAAQHKAAKEALQQSGQLLSILSALRRTAFLTVTFSVLWSPIAESIQPLTDPSWIGNNSVWLRFQCVNSSATVDIPGNVFSAVIEISSGPVTAGCNVSYVLPFEVLRNSDCMLHMPIPTVGSSSLVVTVWLAPRNIPGSTLEGLFLLTRQALDAFTLSKITPESSHVKTIAATGGGATKQQVVSLKPAWVQQIHDTLHVGHSSPLFKAPELSIPLPVINRLEAVQLKPLSIGGQFVVFGESIGTHATKNLDWTLRWVGRHKLVIESGSITHELRLRSSLLKRLLHDPAFAKEVAELAHDSIIKATPQLRATTYQLQSQLVIMLDSIRGLLSSLKSSTKIGSHDGQQVVEYQALVKQLWEAHTVLRSTVAAALKPTSS
eukprot:GILK01014282.1.p1 GENE.GILK01014282.1~~GILK01014282.1.p1  ORF type:complete len:777 (-),score=123.42 GILK01014282.1:172-2202(-)